MNIIIVYLMLQTENYSGVSHANQTQITATLPHLWGKSYQLLSLQCWSGYVKGTGAQKYK